MAGVLSFLDLPAELRLQIYSYAFTLGDLTISARPSRHGEDRSYADIPGLPPHYKPVVRHGYSRDLVAEAATETPAWDAAYVESQHPESTAVPKWEGFKEEPDACTDCAYGTSPARTASATVFRHPRSHPRHPPLKSIDTSVGRRHARSSHTTSISPMACKPVQYSDDSAAIPNTSLNLRLTCKKVNADIESMIKYKGSIKLYLTFPYGVCAVVHHYNHLLRQARSIKIAGLFDIDSVGGVQEVREEVSPSMESRRIVIPQNLSPIQTTRLSMAQSQLTALDQLVCFLLGRESPAGTKAVNSANHPEDVVRPQRSPNVHAFRQGSPLQSLTLRLYYPNGELEGSPSSLYAGPSNSCFHPLWVQARHRARSGNQLPFHCLSSRRPNTISTYSEIWTNPLAPSSKCLHNISGGVISLSVARGAKGTGIEIVASGNGGKARYVTGSWPGMPRERDSGAWAIDETWGSPTEADGRLVEEKT